jgi:hypothetical protein
MCLSNISSDPKKLASFRQHIGWKVFRLTDREELIFEFQRHQGSSLVERKTWLKSSCKIRARARVIDAHKKTYRRYYLRFHVYLRKPKALGYDDVAKKVHWRGLVATGNQWGIPIVVANQIKVN